MHQSVHFAPEACSLPIGNNTDNKMMFIKASTAILIIFYLINNGLADRNYRYREFDDEIGKNIKIFDNQQI